MSARHLSSQGTCEMYLSRHFFVTRLLISVVYIIALCSSINTTIFCFRHLWSSISDILDTPLSQGLNGVVITYHFHVSAGGYAERGDIPP
jgi:hypothetical protein